METIGRGAVTSNPYLLYFAFHIPPPSHFFSLYLPEKNKILVKCKCLWLERREKRALEMACNYGGKKCTGKY